MKWDGFVVYEGSEKKPTSPISHLDASHCRSSLSNHKPFFLKTCEKLKTSNSKSGAKDKIIGNQENFQDSVLNKMMSKITFKASNISRVKQQNSFEKQNEKDKAREIQQLSELTESFIKQFQGFLMTFLQKHQQIKPKTFFRQALQKKIIQSIQESISFFLRPKQNGLSKDDSSIKQSNFFTEVNDKILKPHQETSPAQKKISRALQFKNEKITEKNGLKGETNKDSQAFQQKTKEHYHINSLQSSINEVNKIIDSTSKPKVFTRTGRMGGPRPKRDRSEDSSVEDIMERSLNDSLQSSRSRLKAREALYQYNRALNQTNG